MGVSILYAFGSRADEVANWLAQRQQELPPGGSDVDIGARAAPGVFWQVADKVRLAIALEDLEHIDEALRCYDACLKLEPAMADAHFNAARLHERLGHATQAIRHYSAYRRLQR